MRYSGRNLGRFNIGYETADINAGIQAELTNPIGTTCAWYTFDSTSTVFDPVYDVGHLESNSAGRRWKAPITLQVFSAIWNQGSNPQAEAGFYNTDFLHLSFNRISTEERFPDMFIDPERRAMDRVVYHDRVWQPVSLQPRGLLIDTYVVAGVTLQQVMPDEMVNDAQFAAYVGNAIIVQPVVATGVGRSRYA